MKTITVKGVGTVSAKPDKIKILLKIASKDKVHSKCTDNANSRVAMLQKALCAAGFVKEDLKTLAFGVNTVHNNDGKRSYVEYMCAYRLSLSFDLDIKRLSETLNAISGSGADADFSISFTVKDPEKVSEEMLKSAAANARRNAEILCVASGVTLGELVSIKYDWGEVEFSSPTVFSAGREMLRCASVPEIEPEDIKSTDTATFVWEIKEN